MWKQNCHANNKMLGHIVQSQGVSLTLSFTKFKTIVSFFKPLSVSSCSLLSFCLSPSLPILNIDAMLCCAFVVCHTLTFFFVNRSSNEFCARVCVWACICLCALRCHMRFESFASHKREKKNEKERTKKKLSLFVLSWPYSKKQTHYNSTWDTRIHAAYAFAYDSWTHIITMENEKSARIIATEQSQHQQNSMSCDVACTWMNWTKWNWMAVIVHNTLHLVGRCANVLACNLMRLTRVVSIP